jgi:hypothetical protein
MSGIVIVILIYHRHKPIDLKYLKLKLSPETSHDGLQVCEMLRIPHCLDSRLTDGDKVVSPTHWPRSSSQKHYCYASGTHLC